MRHHGQPTNGIVVGTGFVRRRHFRYFQLKDKISAFVSIEIRQLECYFARRQCGWFERIRCVAVRHLILAIELHVHSDLFCHACKQAAERGRKRWTDRIRFVDVRESTAMALLSQLGE